MLDLAHRVRPALQAALLSAACLLTGMGSEQLAAQQTDWRPYLAGKQPSETELTELLSQLNDMLGSRDSALRDETAYMLLSRWILKGDLIDNRECVRLCNTWTSNLKHDLQETPASKALTADQRDEAVLKRSFSALSLALLASRDNQRQFLDAKALDHLVHATANYLRAEPDERGFVKELGWVHPTAHAADLVRQLAKNPRLTAAQQDTLANCVIHRIQRVRTAFTAGEDDRLARAVLEIVHRPKFEPSQLRDWLTSISNLPRPEDTGHSIAFGHNRRLLVQSLLMRLLLDQRQTETAEACATLTKQALQGKFQKPR